MYGNKYPTFFSFADPVGNDSGFDFFTGGDDNIQLHYNSYFPSDSGFGLDPKELHGVDPLKYEQVDFMDMEEEMMMMRPPSSRFDDDMFEDDNYNSDGEEDERDVSNDDMEMNEEDDEEEELSDQSSKYLYKTERPKRFYNAFLVCNQINFILVWEALGKKKSPAPLRLTGSFCSALLLTYVIN